MAGSPASPASQLSQPAPADPTYTLFIRVPRPRGDFVDPPPVNWDSTKDDALWAIVSRPSKTEIDWNEIAARFHVTVDFLLQQVAFLNERHDSQLRAQMRKAAAAASKGSAGVSPQLGPESPIQSETVARNAPGLATGAISGSGPPLASASSRAPSALTIRKDSPMPRNDPSSPSTPIKSSPRPPATRNSSSNTTTAAGVARNLASSTRTTARQPPDSQRRRFSSLPITSSPTNEDTPGPMSPGPADTSEPESPSSSSSSSPAQSRIIRRPPRFQSQDGASPLADDDDDEDDEDDTEPAFLPQAHNQQSRSKNSAGGQQNLSSTLRDDSRRSLKHSARHRLQQSQHSDSSADSPGPVSKKAVADKTQHQGPLSPRRTAELSGRIPSGKGKEPSRDSDGTPSMGSSFSDLDDASVTQSALEEALASRMGDAGTIGSLRGTISNAFRGSKYLR